MKVAGYTFNPKHMVMEVYVSGCTPPHCMGCHNPETWDFNYGRDVEDIYCLLHKEVSTLGKLVKGWWIMGGEPLDQDLPSLKEFLYELNGIHNGYMMLFTKYDYSKMSLAQRQIIHEWFKYVKHGRYNSSYPPSIVEVNGVPLTLASNNQYIVEY